MCVLEAHFANLIPNHGQLAQKLALGNPTVLRKPRSGARQITRVNAYHLAGEGGLLGELVLTGVDQVLNLGDFLRI
jgi:hypothetical protein